MAKKPRTEENDDALAIAVAEFRRMGHSDLKYRIMRRLAGTQDEFLRWREVDPESITDLEQFCFSASGRSPAQEGSDAYDYKVGIIGSNGKRVRGEDGHVPEDRVIFGVPDAEKVLPAGSRPKGESSDIDDLEKDAERKSRLARVLSRQRLAEKQLAKAEKALENDGDPEDGDGSPGWPLGRGVEYQMREVRPGVFRAFPVDKEEKKSGGDDLLKVMLASQENSTRLMIAMLSQPKESGLGQIAGLLPLLRGEQFSMKDMMPLMSSMMGEAMKMSSFGAKSAADLHSQTMQMLIQNMIEQGAPDDEIERVKRIVDITKGAVTDALELGIGRKSLFQLGQKIDVPKLSGPAAKKALPAGSPAPNPPTSTASTLQQPAVSVAAPAAPPPAAKPEPQVSGPPGSICSNLLPPPGYPAFDPPKDTSPVVYDRLRAFMAILGHEMAAAGDPSLLAEKCLDDDSPDDSALYRGLHEDVRDKIESVGTTQAVFSEIGKYAPAEVAWAIEVTSGDASMRKWLETFFKMIHEAAEAADGPEDPEEPEAKEA